MRVKAQQLTASKYQFSATVTGGVPPYNIVWNFGDGTTGTGAIITHTYSNPGNYTISVTVTDSLGQVKSATTSLTVVAPNEFTSGQTLKILAPGGKQGFFLITDDTANGEGFVWATKTNELDIAVSIDGNVMNLTSTYFSQTYTQPFKPGGYNSTYATAKPSPIQWGATLTGYLIDSSIYPGPGTSNSSGGFSGFLPWLQQNFPGAYLGTIQIKIPTPILTIKDMGVISGITHNIYVTYEDENGNPLSIVSNTMSIGVVGDGSGGAYQVPSGLGTIQYDIQSGQSIYAYLGPIYQGGTPYTPNTIISNAIVIQ